MSAPSVQVANPTGPLGALRGAPAAVPALAAVALLVVWASDQAGYPLTHWVPGGLFVMALLVIALAGAPPRLADVPVTVKVALACLAAYTLLSFLSIVWAAVPGDAWEGANRTLLYMMVFALFGLWRARGASAAVLVSLWTLGLIGLAIYVAVRVNTTSGKGFEAMFAGERLIYPAGYSNATAAQWLMAFWPALLLARSARMPWALRGVLAAGAVVLADLALLSQSRGSLYGTGVMIVLVLVLVPQRLRTFATAVPLALAIGLTAPLVLRVGDRIQSGQSPYAAAHGAVAAMFLAALLAGLVVGLGAAVESRRSISPAFATAVRRGVGVVALLTLIAVLVGGFVVAGNPVTRVRHGWESFEGGHPTTAQTGNRLLTGLGSNRYDFYRVALDAFTSHPLTGIGADNFQQQYLRQGRSEETPRYPHSVELRTLAQTGIVGGLLAIVGMAAALAAGWRAMRRSDPLGQAIAVAALGGFVYWAVHGSFDWFWEFAGLGAPAFALLGIACSLQPAASPVVSTRRRRVSSGSRWLPRALGVVAAVAVLLSLALPWLSERQIQSAARIWPKAPFVAYGRLDDAAGLNPLSDQAYLVEGSIALRFGDLTRARREFSLALGRVPSDAYATLELGAIASEFGEPARSLVLLKRAARLNPRDPITREALRTVRSGKRVSIVELNRSILLKAEFFA